MKKYILLFLYSTFVLSSEITEINDAVLAGESWNSLKSNKGTLSVLYWKIDEVPFDPDYCTQDDCAKDILLNSLIFRYKNSDGKWVDEKIISSSRLGWRQKYFGMMSPVRIRDTTNSNLFFDKAGLAHIIAYNDEEGHVVHFVRDNTDNMEFSTGYGVIDSHWSVAEIIDLPSINNQEYFYMLAEMDASGYFHIVFNADNALHYGTNKSGSWLWDIATEEFYLVRDSSGYGEDATTELYFEHNLPRFVSLAIDVFGNAHISYCPSFDVFINQNNTMRQTSKLYYATNLSGKWLNEEVIIKPRRITDDAGRGSSIAIDPVTNTPVIASFYIKRVSTGSSQASKLLFHKKKANGNWVTSTIASKADGYISGDGNMGTGFAPFVKFNSSKRPEILFSDYASKHFSGAGQDAVSGQIRLAKLNDKNKWTLKTVFKQKKPFINHLLYPSFLIENNIYSATIEKDILSENGKLLQSSNKVLIIE